MRTLVVCCLLVSALSIKLFLIGGAANENSTEVFSALANVIPSRAPLPKKCDDNWSTTKCPRIAVVTSASDTTADGNDSYSNDTAGVSYRTLFGNYGMTPKHITLHRDNFKVHADVNTPEGKANLAIIMQADVIFFNGGDQARHVRSWMLDDGRPSSLLQALKDRALANEIVCSGSSAGSMVWDTVTFGDGTAFGVLYYRNSLGFAPKKIIDGQIGGSGLNDNRTGTSSLQSNYNAGKMPAFGFINFTVDTHFNARGRLGRLTPALIDLKERYGIGIDENTSMYYDNGVGTVYGWNGVTINDLTEARQNPVAYFTISNVIGHYLTQGDKFDFKTMTVISNKTLISTPYYNGPTDSNDILAAYEAPLLQTRLVDQRSLYNLGKTKKPSAFPSSTPTFELKFYRNAQTKGYFGNHKYTVSNIVIDFSYATNIAKHLSLDNEEEK